MSTYPDHPPLNDAPEPDPWDDPAYISELDEEADDAEENAHPPLSFTPSATAVHPMALVFSLLMRHANGIKDNGHTCNVDEKCCRPYRIDVDTEQPREDGKFAKKEAE